MYIRFVIFIKICFFCLYIRCALSCFLNVFYLVNMSIYIFASKAIESCPSFVGFSMSATQTAGKYSITCLMYNTRRKTVIFCNTTLPHSGYFHVILPKETIYWYSNQCCLFLNRGLGACFLSSLVLFIIIAPKGNIEPIEVWFRYDFRPGCKAFNDTVNLAFFFTPEKFPKFNTT